MVNIWWVIDISNFQVGITAWIIIVVKTIFSSAPSKPTITICVKTSSALAEHVDCVY